MGKQYSEIDGTLQRFIEAQQVFFVATAPSGSEGHVNLSPKGLHSLRVLGPRSVGYVDFVGSGVETIAHLRENGRIVILFCAFEGSPKILRLHGRGIVHEPSDPEFVRLRDLFSDSFPARSIIVVSVERISDSCGYGVPLYEYKGQRDQLAAWADRKGEDGLRRYQLERNAGSIDGLPGLIWAESSGTEKDGELTVAARREQP